MLLPRFIIKYSKWQVMTILRNAKAGLSLFVSLWFVFLIEVYYQTEFLENK